MGRYSTMPYLFDEVKTLNIKKLIEWQYLKPNICNDATINWNRNGEKYSSIGALINTNTMTIQFHYTFQETIKIQYTVNLIKRPSNLGKGEMWLFECPETGKLCRKLYFYRGKFLHREAANGFFYQSQIYSKQFRGVSYYSELENNYMQLYKKHLKKHYRGKPTKKFRKLTYRIKMGEKIAPYIERLF